LGDNTVRYDTGISDAVREQIDKMFSNKASGELEALETQARHSCDDEHFMARIVICDG
jgi:hypothetical protein